MTKYDANSDGKGNVPKMLLQFEDLQSSDQLFQELDEFQQSKVFGGQAVLVGAAAVAVSLIIGEEILFDIILSKAQIAAEINKKANEAAAQNI